MKLIIDFDNNTITSEQGILSVPELADKKEELFQLLGLELIDTNELKEDINNLFSELGFTDVKA